jgi:hypothetical protein
MERQIIVKGEARGFAFLNVKIPLNDDEHYKITERDKVIFSIGRKNRKPVIVKEYPKDFDKEWGNTFVIHLTADETARLPCLLYQMQLTIDVESLGEEIYTLVNQELEVVAK